MPKALRRYNYDNYTSPYTSYSGTLYPQTNVADFNRYEQIRKQKLNQQQRVKYHRKRKKTTAQYVVSFCTILFMLFAVMPYGFNHMTKELFVPTSYKEIQTDLTNLAFPATKYLSNAWFLGQRSVRFAADEKHAQMIKPKENVNMPSLRSELLNLMELYPTVKPAIYVWDYDTQNYIDINASKVYSTASIIKIPVLIKLFKAIEAGDISLSETMPLTEYYRTEGSGDMQFKAVNSLWSIDRLASLMITDSDNTATNMLVAKVGSMTSVNQAIRDWGLKNTEIKEWLPDLGGNNITTAREMGVMLYNIDSNEKLLNQESRAKIFDYMSHVHNDRLIPAGLGKGSVIYHKTGDIGTMLGDAGIVITPSGQKYVVVILATRNHNAPEGKDFIVKASEIIYNYMVK